jgi:hypothetical protein
MLCKIGDQPISLIEVINSLEYWLKFHTFSFNLLLFNYVVRFLFYECFRFGFGDFFILENGSPYHELQKG